jgi:hypothetical protein
MAKITFRLRISGFFPGWEPWHPDVYAIRGEKLAKWTIRRLSTKYNTETNGLHEKGQDVSGCGTIFGPGIEGGIIPKGMKNCREIGG